MRIIASCPLNASSWTPKLNKRPWRLLGFQNWSFFIDVEVYVLNDLFRFFVYCRQAVMLKFVVD